MESYSDEGFLNIGTGEDITIKELAGLVKSAVGLEGEIVFDTSKPDGTPRKLMDVSRLAASGWQPRIGLSEGIADTYQWYLANQDAARR
jgi:GDP-L-fucose synthase